MLAQWAIRPLVLACTALCATTALGNARGYISTDCSGCHTGAAQGMDVELDVTFGADWSSRHTLAIRIIDAPVTGTRGGFVLDTDHGRLVPENQAQVWNNFFGGATQTEDGSHQRAWTVGWQLSGQDLPVHGCAAEMRIGVTAANGNDLDDAGDASHSRTIAVALGDAGIADTSLPPQPVFRKPEAGAVVISGVSFKSELPGSLVIGPVTIEVEAGDDVGVAAVRLTDTDALGNVSGPVAMTHDGGNTWIHAWETLGLTPGPHTLRIEAEDCGGNLSEAAELEVFAF